MNTKNEKPITTKQEPVVYLDEYFKLIGMIK